MKDLFQEFEQILDESQPESPERSYETGSNTDGNKKEALGLGLSVVARYVRNMHGKIRVQSEEGNGTMFTLELPFDHVANENNLKVGVLPDLKGFSTPTTELAAVKTAPVFGNDSNNLQLAGLSGFQRTLAATIDSSMKSPTNRIARMNDDVTRSPRRGFPPRSQDTEDQKWLPRHNSATPSLSARSPTVTSTADTHSYLDVEDKKVEHYNVLIAEDNPVNAKVLRRRLEKSGHTVTHAVDGQACHDLFNTNEKYDVILMDIQVRLDTISVSVAD